MSDEEQVGQMPRRIAAVLGMHSAGGRESLVAAAAADIELKVEVSEFDGVRDYGFAFGGVPVVPENDVGVFFAEPGVETLLEWVMVGDPGGTMKVVVTRDGEAIRTREASTIPPSAGKGYDFFRLKVS